MRTLKKLLLVTMLAVTIAIAMTITGCGQTAGENENGENFSVEPESEKDTPPSVEQEEEDEFLFCFVVRDAYEISEEGTVVTGFVYRGTMRAGDAALLLKEDGTVFEVRVKQMEVKDEEADAVVAADEVVGTKEGMPAGVWLEGIESRQIDNADILLGIEE